MGKHTDNVKRAGWAMEAIKAHNDATGIGDEDMETQLSDLVTNLRHVADAQKVDWSEVERRALGHYDAETAFVCPSCGAKGSENDFDFVEDGGKMDVACYKCGKVFAL